MSNFESTNPKYTFSNNLILSGDWNKAQDNDYRTTKDGLVETKGKTELNFEPLINLAAEVISKLN